MPGPHRNLLRRPAKPALGNGRLQRQCKRAFGALGGQISTSDAISWCYRAVTWGERSRNGFNVAARRALESIGAVRVGRVPPYGAWLWRLPDDG
jgi:hypothetical protein